MISIELKQPNGKYKTFHQDMIPYRKRFEYSKAEVELLKNENQSERTIQLAEYQVEFVASLFDQEEVTKDSIMDGLDTADSNCIAEIIYYDVMNFPKPGKDDGKEEKKDK